MLLNCIYFVLIYTKQITSDPEKSTKFDFLSSRISDVQDHLTEVSDQTGKKFNIIKENVKNE